jgi:mannose-1-phosphate guanylyltransferase/phosphomannomutase
MEGFANANVVSSGPGADLRESVDRVARIVPTVGAAFGAVVGPEAERVQFVDDEGQLVPDDVMLACLIRATCPRKAVFPINLSNGYGTLTEEGGGTVEISRTGIGNLALRAADVRADLASLADGRYIFSSFLPAPDCFMTIARALEAFRSEPLSGLRRDFDEPFGNVVRERLDCPWTAKGRVMRGLAEKFGGDPDAILTEGVRLSVDGGWVLMLPDPDNPVFYVYAEPGDGGDPHALAGDYVDLVRSLIEEGTSAETSS